MAKPQKQKVLVGFGWCKLVLVGFGRFWLVFAFYHVRLKIPEIIGSGFVTFIFRLFIEDIWPFCAAKTMLSKLENLWYLQRKKVNFNAQYWLWCTKKVKSHRQIDKQINIPIFQIVFDFGGIRVQLLMTSLLIDL